MGISYEIRNNRKYAYECSSKRVPGKKHPVSSKRYLGVVDPETGEIIPKKVKPSSKRFRIEDRKISVLDYGNVLLIDRVAKGLGILEDLSMTFGNADRGTMALAMVQAMAPAPFMDTDMTMRSSCIRELLGTGGMDFSSQRTSEMTRVIGDARTCMEDFFERRAMRCVDNTFLYDLTSQSTHSDVRGWAEWGHNRDGEAMRQTNIGLITDREGVPVAFDVFPGSISDTVTLDRVVGDMRRRSPGCIMVMDRGFENAGNVRRLIDREVDFIMPCNVNGKAVKSLLTRFAPEATRPEYDRMHDGHVYSVWEQTLGVEETVENGKRRSRYLTERDAGFDGCRRKVNAYVCHDSKKRNDDEQELKSALLARMRELEGRRFRDPARSFPKAVGWMSKYLDYELDDEGAIHVVHKRNAMTFFRNRAGMFVLITSSDVPWETVMASYDARDAVEKSFDVFKTDLDGRRGRTGDPVTARGRLFVRFLALMIRVRMQSTIAGSRLRNLTVENAIISAGTYKVVSDGEEWVRTERTKRVREIFELFGVEDDEICSSMFGN